MSRLSILVALLVIVLVLAACTEKEAGPAPATPAAMDFGRSITWSCRALPALSGASTFGCLGLLTCEIMELFGL